jgi:hypothetical protein
VAVRIAKIDAAAAVPIIELSVCEAPRRAAECNFGLLDAAQNGIEFAVTGRGRRNDDFRTLNPRPLNNRVSDLLILTGEKITGVSAFEPENASEELGRGDFVTRRNDGVIERDGLRRPPTQNVW